MTQQHQPDALADEYRPTMDKEVLHCWAADACSELRRLHARVQHLDAQRKQLQSDAELWKAEAAQAEKWRGMAKRTPLTDEQASAIGREAVGLSYELDIFIQGIRFGERAHGITGDPT